MSAGQQTSEMNKLTSGICRTTRPFDPVDRPVYRQRCFRLSGDLAQATAFCNGGLLQSAGCRTNCPTGNRNRIRSLAMAARRRNPKGQLTAAYDLRADFRFAHLLSLLDALAPPRERLLAGYCLFRSDVARADGDHAHWTSRWNTQRR